MDEKEALKRLVLDFNLEDMSDLEELKDICIGSDKFLESKMSAIKLMEAEIFAKTVKLTETRLRVMQQIADKIKEAQVTIPYSDHNLRKYMLNKMFCFYTKQEKLEEIEEFTASEELQEKFKGQILTKLILRDSRSRTAEYLLVYSTSSFFIEAVYSYEAESDAITACQTKEVGTLVEKLFAFMGRDFIGNKKLVIDDLIRFYRQNSPDDESKQDMSECA